MNNQIPASGSQEAEQYQHIGAYLKEMREHFRLSAQDVAKRLHIRPKYILALEEGKIQDLPGRVYTIGYLQTYAEFLGLDATKILEEYQEIQLLDARETFKVMEPHHHHGAPAAKLMVGVLGALVIIFLLWQFFSSGDEAAMEPVVEALPDHLVQSSDHPLVITGKNRLCLTPNYASVFPPCFGADFVVAPTPFIMVPYRHALELQ